MIYPENFEQKIGFNQVRNLLKGYCVSTLGKEKVNALYFSTSHKKIDKWLKQITELRKINVSDDNFTLSDVFDIRESVSRIKLRGTYIETEELYDLKRTIETTNSVVNYLRKGEEQSNGEIIYNYPELCDLTKGIDSLAKVVTLINNVVDSNGNIKDTASKALREIRVELLNLRKKINSTINSILKNAQKEGIVEKDTLTTLREGRILIPVVANLKKKIPGIVHAESSTGHTVFIEPAQVVEINNHIKELENKERREIIRILIELSDNLRLYIPQILAAIKFIASIDLIAAKAQLAEKFKAIEPELSDKPIIDWVEAINPLLKLNSASIIPLNITLTNDKNILIISGPNAGGKSVCLKTVGLLQYMLQCGISVPIAENSKIGIFKTIMIDIGDEQSIENALSTYSSHLLNMKAMITHADTDALILIDEFGTGTEPQIGAAIAEAILKKIWEKGIWAVITTHYQNLKHFAENHEGIVNGAMLYDRHNMKPLFQLAIGRPGSSFAIEIARKIGLPEEVIDYAANIVGSDYIQSDKYLQDIVRDKRYWEAKRSTIHKNEKDLQRKIENYELELHNLKQRKKEIIDDAKRQAEELILEANKNIENIIREIRKKQAEHEVTKKLRAKLTKYKNEVTPKNENIVKREIPTDNMYFKQGDYVKINGLNTIGKIEKINEKTAIIIFGDVKTKIDIKEIEPTTKKEIKQQLRSQKNIHYSTQTRETIDEHRSQFKQEIDVRGMRTEEALVKVQNFIDDAILASAQRVRILHGKGNGILRMMIRNYLKTIPNVNSIKDEHIQLGGAGITVVEL